MISILIPSKAWMNMKHLKTTVRSIQENTSVEYEIIVWNNEFHNPHNTNRWALQNNVRMWGTPDNLGISRPYNRLVKVAKYATIMLSDDDYYYFPGWDKAYLEVAEGAIWRAPLQVTSLPEDDTIVKGCWGLYPDSFKEKEALEYFRTYVHPHRHISIDTPCIMTKETYWAIGGFDERFPLSEMHFMWKAFCLLGEGEMLTHPEAFFYHFPSKTPRPPWFQESKETMMKAFESDFGLTVQEANDKMGVLRVHEDTIRRVI